ncbi:Ig-like domain repeat protein [Streptomyces sp. SID13726]|uniref:Ig-like domain repeat protein n=1 Tax=Streptomyces sp. SID13726 TaxID=2706058 RepID=UPI0013B95953|nr:Ig-like domain repeat protein [Streptomyces sp. SID13726]
MRIRTLPAAVATAALFGSLLLAASPAAADTSVPIGVGDVHDTVVDGAHQHLYMSTGDGIAVVDHNGKVVTTLTGLPQVSDLQLSADGSTLYAAVTGADKIVAFDTATLAQTGSYPTGAGTAPRRIAVTQGRIWFGYGDQWDSGLGEVDLTADPATVRLDLAGAHDFASTPMLYADPADPDTLVALDGGISSGPIVVYDISSGTPVIRVTADEGGFYRDAAFTPGGQSIVVVGPFRRAAVEYRLSDLAQVHTYPVNDQTDTVTVAPDGTVAVTSLDTDNTGDTYDGRGGADAPASVRNLSSSWMPWGGHTTAWSADGTKLFVLTGSSDSMQFQTVNEPRKYVTKLAVNAPATATRAKTLTVKGTLTTGLKPPAGTPVNIVRTDLLSPAGKSLGTAKLGADGAFSFTDAPPAGGSVRYSVTYPGDAAHTSSSASDTVTVSRATPALTLTNNKKTYDYGKKVTFTAHLGTTYSNRTVEIWADPYGADKPNKLLKSGKVDAHGNLSASVTMSRDTAVKAVYKGDARYAPRTAKSNAYAHVKIAASLSKYYKTGTIGSTRYRYFHKNTDAILTTTMTYYQGRKQRLDLQVYSGGRWTSAGSEYFALGTNGKSVVNLGHAGTAGVRARIRAVYVDPSSGDSVNTTTIGSWQYFYFSN